MPGRKKRPYEVGYGKPPVVGQFQKGKSGNPQGRPKGAKSLATLIREELAQKIVVTENGVSKRVTKAKAFAKQLYRKSISGNTADSKLFLSTLIQLGYFRAEVRPESESEVIQVIAELPGLPPWQRNCENWNDRKFVTSEKGVKIKEVYEKRAPSEGPFIVDPFEWTNVKPGEERDAFERKTVPSKDKGE